MPTRCILVAEDYKPLLLAIQSILEAEGYAVLAASNGEEALRLMERVRPDLILADIMMPGMNGYAFLEAVRSRPEWSSIPFIFLSARAEQEDLEKGKAMGVTGYLIKPFEPQELIEIVRRHLGEG